MSGCNVYRVGKVAKLAKEAKTKTEVFPQLQPWSGF